MDENNFEQELQKQLVFWQKALYLQDWTISLRIVRQWEMGDTFSIAQCEWFIQRKDAIIKVLHHADLLGVKGHFLNGEECDYDISLVHELLHLHFAPFHSTKNDVTEEQAINAISRSIVKVWRSLDNTAQTSFAFMTPNHNHGYL
jgi:hypothetical protein